MPAERAARRPSLRERLLRPGLQYEPTENGWVPFTERRVPEHIPLLIYSGFCDDPDPNDEALDGFAALGRSPIRYSEPVGSVFAISRERGISLKHDDIAAYTEAFKKHVPEGEPVEIAGISQGGVLALKVAQEIAPRNPILHIGLVVPAGCMEGHCKEDSKPDKKIEMIRRAGGWIADQGGDAITVLREEGIQSLVSGCRTIAHMFADPVRSSRRARFASDTDIIPDMYGLIDRYNTFITTVVGEYDKIFPGNVVEANIRNRGVVYSSQPKESNPRVKKLLTGHNTKWGGRKLAENLFREMRLTENPAD